MTMVHERAGHLPTEDQLIDVAALERAFFDQKPDPSVAAQRVAFGTSGHRGSSLKATFNEAHVAAIAQAISDYRRRHDTNGPLYVGMDTHALSAPAQRVAVEVFAANGVDARIASTSKYTPTPAVSFAILAHHHQGTGKADGVVITPSHNPPEDGGFKYNPPHGGPAGTDITAWIETRANSLLESGLRDVKRTSYEHAIASVNPHDFIGPYVDALADVIDMEAIAGARLRIGADPMGGAGIDYWPAIAERHGLRIDVVNEELDPRFAFMPLDKDGRIRMDCSSPYAMAGLVGLRGQYDIAFGNDTDFDRHGVVTKSWGLLNPNHYLAVAIDYLFATRTEWPGRAAIGKTLVTSAMVDRVGARAGRRVAEVPVGFKWFVDGLLNGSYGFGGEESAGASFLRRDGRAWSTDKDGILLNLLAAEITATTDRDPGEHYQALTEAFGTPHYERIDAPATREQKARLKALQPSELRVKELGGEEIENVLTKAPENDSPIGGIKVIAKSGWFAARPSGTEDVYKIYAESFVGREHLQEIQRQAKRLVDRVLDDV